MEEQALKDAQYRKALSIAYFNSINSAIELAKVMFPEMEKVDVKEFIKEWRDWFIEEHKKHYLQSVAQVGIAYDKDSAIKKLESAESFSDLQVKWVSLSQDERNDSDIRNVALAMRKKYEKA